MDETSFSSCGAQRDSPSGFGKVLPLQTRTVCPVVHYDLTDLNCSSHEDVDTVWAMDDWVMPSWKGSVDDFALPSSTKSSTNSRNRCLSRRHNAFRRMARDLEGFVQESLHKAIREMSAWVSKELSLVHRSVDEQMRDARIRDQGLAHERLELQHRHCDFLLRLEKLHKLTEIHRAEEQRDSGKLDKSEDCMQATWKGPVPRFQSLTMKPSGQRPGENYCRGQGASCDAGSDRAAPSPKKVEAPQAECTAVLSALAAKLNERETKFEEALNQLRREVREELASMRCRAGNSLSPPSVFDEGRLSHLARELHATKSYFQPLLEDLQAALQSKADTKVVTDGFQMCDRRLAQLLTRFQTEKAFSDQAIMKCESDVKALASGLAMLADAVRQGRCEDITTFCPGSSAFGEFVVRSRGPEALQHEGRRDCDMSHHRHSHESALDEYGPGQAMVWAAWSKPCLLGDVSSGFGDCLSARSTCAPSSCSTTAF